MGGLPQEVPGTVPETAAVLLEAGGRSRQGVTSIV
jgi:hypothetical protein